MCICLSILDFRSIIWISLNESPLPYIPYVLHALEFSQFCLHAFSSSGSYPIIAFNRSQRFHIISYEFIGHRPQGDTIWEVPIPNNKSTHGEDRIAHLSVYSPLIDLTEPCKAVSTLSLDVSAYGEIKQINPLVQRTRPWTLLGNIEVY